MLSTPGATVVLHLAPPAPPCSTSSNSGGAASWRAPARPNQRSYTPADHFPIIHNTPPLKKTARFVYPFNVMMPGDAFDAPDDMGRWKCGSSKRAKSIRSCAQGYIENHNPAARFTVVKIGDIIRCRRDA
jgi:hypothetical protein